MENMIQTFVNEEFGSLRTLEENGKILFCGKDVATALGYSNTKDAIKRHCRWGVKHALPHPQSPNKTIEMFFIPEGDVYRLIAHSRLPAAERFEEWIFDEVLPTIRRTGGYVGNEDMFVESYLPFADDAVKNLFRLNLMTIRQLNEKIRRDEPLVQFANQVADTENVIDIGRMAKLANEENIRIGRNTLFRWLKGRKILMSNNIPYQQFIDRGYFVVKESVYEQYGMQKTYQQTYVTGKGQQYIKKTKKKIAATLASAVAFANMLTMQAYAAGDVSGAIQSTWNDAKSQIKSIVNNVVFPVLDVVLVILLFVKIGTLYMEYRKHGQFEWTPVAIIFGCLLFTLTAPLYIWSVVE